MNNNYFCISFNNTAELSEVIIALLGELPFDTFEETPTGGVKAYIKAADYSAAVATEVEQLAEQFDVSFQQLEIESENWNEVWESNFHPIVIDHFCGIRADFHQPIADVKHEIIINPKMAFGTGHHETTFMMIQMMEDMDFHQKSVFDFGCGTGILAIMASKLGATEIVGVDNEYPAYESTIENATLNGVPFITSIFGVLENVTQGNFDVIFSNINRNIIVNSLDVLVEKLKTNGTILFSGFLKEDENYMKSAITASGLQYISSKYKGDWVCIKAIK